MRVKVPAGRRRRDVMGRWIVGRCIGGISSCRLRTDALGYPTPGARKRPVLDEARRRPGAVSRAAIGGT
jgi:hypothetical protein